MKPKIAHTCTTCRHAYSESENGFELTECMKDMNPLVPGLDCPEREEN